MFDPSLSPANIQNFLTLKWRGNSQQTVSIVPDGCKPYGEVKTSPRKLKHQKWNSEPPTLGYLDAIEELESINATVKTRKGILKAPKNSRSNPQFETTSRNQTSPNNQLSARSQQTEQETLSNCENLEENKSKKVTFSAETKKPEAKKTLRSVRLKKKIVQNNSDPDNPQVEDSPSNNLTPRAEIALHYSPRYIVKIVKKTSDPCKSPRYPSNSNIPSQQSNDLNNLEDNLEDIFNIPCFEKSLSSDTPIQAYSSLQTMLDESPLYPNANSSEITTYLPQIGSFSARNAALQTPWNGYFNDRRSSGSLAFRDDQFLPKVKQEKNMDYYAELQKKAPLIFQNMPSLSDSKAASRPSSKIRARSDMFIIQKRDFIRPVMNAHERP